MKISAFIQPKMTPEEAQKFLQDRGMQVSIDQAKIVIESLTIFAKSTPHAKVSRPIHKGKH